MKSLVTSHLVLKPISRDHITDDYVSWLNDGDVNKYLETKGNYTIDLLTEFVENQITHKVNMWAIHLKENNSHIGNIKIDPINTKHGYGEYGILIGDKTQWGKGYAKEASQSVIKHFFYDEYKLRKINLGVVSANSAAVK